MLTYRRRSSAQSAQALTDKLVAMGFEEEEARQAVVQEGLEGYGLFGGGTRSTAQAFSYVVQAEPETLQQLRGTPGLEMRRPATAPSKYK